jgi:nitrite reductase/ring-hydroxylating ferredoxin subunit
MGAFVRVLKRSELPEGEVKMVVVGGEEVALFNVKGEIFAIENSCPHQGGPLAEGFVDGHVVTCPWHSWKFDVTTGCATFDETRRQKVYKTKVEGDDILVET